MTSLPTLSPPASSDALPHPSTRVLDYFMTVFRRTFRGTIFTGFLSPLLYLVALGYGLGSLVDRGGAGIAGVPYVQFIAPGILVATAMQVGVFDASWPVLGAIKWQRQFHAMLATPIRVGDIVVGNVAAITLRALLSSVVFLAVAYPIGAIPSWWGVLALIPTALVTCAYAAPMFALSASIERDAIFSVVIRLGLLPMFLFSGTFFPIEQLPNFIQPIAWLVPLWHASSAARDFTLGTISPLADTGHLLYLVLWAVVGGWLAIRQLRRRMVV